MHKLFPLILLAAAAAAQIEPPPPPPPPPPPAFTALRASQAYRDSLTSAALHYERSLSTHCPTVDLQMHNMSARVYGPFQLDGTGGLNAATWKESVPGTACQEARLYNVAVLIRNGKQQILPLLPGHSFAGPQLQHDALPYAGVATAAGRDCPADVLDTSLPGGEPAAGHGLWDEKWTVRACGKRYLVTLHFIPDATGTTINSGFRETVILP